MGQLSNLKLTTFFGTEQKSFQVVQRFTLKKSIVDKIWNIESWRYSVFILCYSGMLKQLGQKF